MSYDEVYHALVGLKSTCGAGPDDVPAIFLRNCAFSLTFPLTSLFNMSLQTGCFPDLWKESFVIPLHKAGDVSDVKNYRPISKLSSIAQMFDSLVHSKLSIVFGPCIIAQQHGFVRGKSTCTNLITLTERIAESFSERSQVDAVYTDFSKAFDKVNLSALIYKLRCSGMRGALLNWVKSYLTDRHQMVKLKDAFSRRFLVRSGVPQGSHLGPLLFTLFINDLSRYLNPRVQFLLFADDCKFFMKISSIDDCRGLQQGLDEFVRYCDLFSLRLNYEKCVKISFTRVSSGRIDYSYSLGGETVGEVSEVKDLGVTLDSHLTYRTHISRIRGKAFGMLGYVIRTCGDFTNMAAVKAVYFAYVRSHLEYCCQVWNTATVTDRLSLERIQRRFARFVYGKGLLSDGEHPEFHYRPVLDALNLQSLECRRDRFDVIFLLRVLFYGLGGLSLDKYYRSHDSTRSLRSHRLYTTLINCPSTLNQCIRLLNEISFDWSLIPNISYSSALRVALESVPLYR